MPIYEASRIGYLYPQEYLNGNRIKKKRDSPLVTHYLNSIQDPYTIDLIKNDSNPKVPIPKSLHLTSESSCEQPLKFPFIFNLNPDGTLDSVTVSIDTQSSFWTNLKDSFHSFLHITSTIDYETITVTELKTILKKFGLNTSGKKIILVEKLKKIREILRNDIGMSF